MNHPTSIELHEYTDGVYRDERQNSEIEIHLRTCATCQAKVVTIKEMADTFGRLPLEHVSPGFTERVMARLGIGEMPSVSWSVLKNLAPVVALVLVTGIVYVVLKLTGSFEQSGVTESVAATQSIYNTISGRLSNEVSMFNGWMKTLFPFLYTKSSYGLIAFLLVVFGVVALLDRYIFVPMFRRRL